MTRLTDHDLKVVAWPSRNPVAGSHPDPKEVVARGLLDSVAENEPLTEDKLAPLEAGAGLSPSIPAGMRAMSVKVNEVVGVAGFVVPGTKVDVLVTLRRNEESMTRTVISNVQVLTAGTRYDQEKAKDGEPIPSTVVTLMVTPAGRGKDHAGTNRRPGDARAPQSAGHRADGHAGYPQCGAPWTARSGSGHQSREGGTARGRRPAPPPAPAPKLYTVEAIRAAKRTEEVVR